MKTKFGFKAITALLLNAMMGVMMASVMGFSATAGAVTAVGVSLAVGPFMPSGALCEGVLTEVWTGELIKTLRAGDVATFLDGLPDYSQYAENDVIHMIDVGGDPDVLVNNTTYPLDVQNITDTDAVFSLDKFQTKPTPVTDDELYASSYDKMASLKERHGDAIKEKKFAKAIHALAPDSNATKTPVLRATGELVDGESGRRRLQIKDIIALKDKFDKLKIPVQGRRLVLCSDHVNDLLLTDQKFKDQYYNYTTGKIANLYGFEVYEYSDNPVYKADGTKVKFGTAAGTNEFQASVAFYIKRVFKASGSTKMYYSEAKTDPLNQRSLVNFRHYFIVLPKKKDAMAAVMSEYVAPKAG
mgnify:CR=1 FL=1